MELLFLGTVAGSPSRERNVSSLALQLAEERGSFWLFDCGEGTQHQLLSTPLRLSRMEFVFITHLHGDHLYGLPGLMTSRSQQSGARALTLFGPPGLKTYLKTVFELSQARLDYEWNVVENREGIIFEDDRFQVVTARLEHRIECWGYRIIEKNLPGRLDAAKLRERDVQPGPIYARLKRGEDVFTEDGVHLKAADYLGEEIPGRVVTILGDTRVCESGERLAADADVLVHEATFSDHRTDLAHKYYHSTAGQAAEMARRNRVRRLLLNHISSRYQGDQVDQLKKEAERFHPDVNIVSDFDCFPIDRK